MITINHQPTTKSIRKYTGAIGVLGAAAAGAVGAVAVAAGPVAVAIDGSPAPSGRVAVLGCALHHLALREVLEAACSLAPVRLVVPIQIAIWTGRYAVRHVGETRGRRDFVVAQAESRSRCQSDNAPHYHAPRLLQEGTSVYPASKSFADNSDSLFSRSHLHSFVTSIYWALVYICEPKEPRTTQPDTGNTWLYRRNVEPVKQRILGLRPIQAGRTETR